MKKIYSLIYALVMLLVFSWMPTGAYAQTEGDKILIYYKGGGAPDEYNCSEIIKIAHDENNMNVYSTTFGEDFPLSSEVKEIEKVVFKFAGNKYIDVDIKNIKLADANATDATKILFAYLQYYYGKNLLTSTVAKVNWNTTGAEHEYAVTGKYPAINCFDFIHIMSSGTWIDYSNTKPVVDWAEKGGVVSLMWHFNVPASEDDFNNQNLDGATCSPDKTTWNMDNIYTDGTWENKWFYGQMGKVCDVLLKLQEQGIVALWRPFHEASGNMLNTQGWPKQAWFWWGTKGGEAYKKLWNTMKTYFEQKGIHNLIWIWTGTAKTATNDADTSYYPGDDNVDIVGCDCYGSSAAELKAQYDGLSALYPTKMIALAECGNLTEDQGSCNKITKRMPKMSEVWAAGAKFLYFMPWYDYYYEEGKVTDSTMFPADYWQDAMGMDNIINMDNWRINEEQ